MENDLYISVLHSIEKLGIQNQLKLFRHLANNLNATRMLFFCDICSKEINNYIEDDFIGIFKCTHCSCKFCDDCHMQNKENFCHECGAIFCKKCEDKMTNLFYCSPECAKKVISRLVPKAISN